MGGEIILGITFFTMLRGEFILGNRHTRIPAETYYGQQLAQRITSRVHAQRG